MKRNRKNEMRFASIITENIARDPNAVKELAEIARHIDDNLKTPAHHEMYALEKDNETLTLCRTVRQYARRCNVNPETYVRIATHVIPTFASNPLTRARMLASYAIFKKVRARLSEDYQRGGMDKIETMSVAYGTKKSVLESLRYLDRVRKMNPRAFNDKASATSLLIALRYVCDPILLYDYEPLRKHWCDLVDMPCALIDARILHTHRSHKVITLMKSSAAWNSILKTAYKKSAA